MTHSLESIIFDLDGVIAETAEFQYLAWKRLAEEENLPIGPEVVELIRGVTRRESLNRILKGREISEETAQAWMARKNAHYLDLLTGLSPADRSPGLMRLIQEAKQAGIKLGIATASRNARAVLGRVDLLEVFDVIGDPGVVSRQKPEPDLFIWVAGHLQGCVEKTLVVEDSVDSIRSARQVGFFTLGIGYNLENAAHLAAPDLSQVTLEWIDAGLARS
jgi:beta-phosphoglucomutase